MNDKCFELTNHFSRREFMHVGFIGGLGLSLADFLQIKSHGAQKFYETKDGPAKSVIHIYLPGGMAHQESWDPKPYAPLEYRGPFKSIKTKIPGVHFSENFKHSAKIADKITVCRSRLTAKPPTNAEPTICSGLPSQSGHQIPQLRVTISHELARKNFLTLSIPGFPMSLLGAVTSVFLRTLRSRIRPRFDNFQVRDLSAQRHRRRSFLRDAVS